MIGRSETSVTGYVTLIEDDLQGLMDRWALQMALRADSMSELEYERAQDALHALTIAWAKISALNRA